jgi:hypothetical protein
LQLEAFPVEKCGRPNALGSLKPTFSSCRRALPSEQGRLVLSARGATQLYQVVGIRIIMPELKLHNKSGGRGRGVALAAFAVWLCAISGGTVWMTRHSNIPGPDGDVPALWPAQSTIALARTNSTLVMFAHPRCPCTRASINELEVLMARTQGRISAHVVFLRPAELPATWTETSLWRQAAAIPGVTVQMDINGAEARRFGSGTSGDTMVYAADGRLLFHGGITISRGHEGDNPGLSAISALSQSRTVETAQTPVFGCALFSTQCPERGPL